MSINLKNVVNFKLTRLKHNFFHLKKNVVFLINKQYLNVTSML